MIKILITTLFFCHVHAAGVGNDLTSSKLKPSDRKILFGFDLNCMDGTNCTWRNAEGEFDSLKFEQVTNIKQGVLKRLGTNQPTESSYGLWDGGIGDQGVLISNVLPCQLNDATVLFDLYTTDNALVDVCVRKAGDASIDGILSCAIPEKQKNGKTWSSELPQYLDGKVEIMIAVYNFFTKDDVALINNIKYDGKVCGETDRTLPATLPVPISTTPRIYMPTGNPFTLGDTFRSACDTVRCSFNPHNFKKDGKICGFKNTGTTNFIIGPKTKSEGPESLNDGTAPAESFAHAIVKQGETAILQSDKIKVPKDVELRFMYHDSSRNVSLSMCLDGLANCPFVHGASAPNKKSKWQSSIQVVPKGTTRVLFYVNNAGPKTVHVAIDDIYLFATDGTYIHCHTA